MNRGASKLFSESPNGGLPSAASITTMEGTSSRSPSPGQEADEWANALERAGGRKLRTYIRHLVGSADAANDILQDARERFWRASGDVKEPGAWLRTVIINLATSHLRLKRREVRLSEESLELVTASNIVESEAERQQSMERFRQALGSLTGEQQSLIDLHYEHELTVREIAQRWGKSVEAIEQRLTRARDRLRAELHPIAREVSNDSSR